MRKEQLAGAVEVAEYLGVPPRTLTTWIYRGTGPKSIKVGRHVKYRWSDVEAWLELQSRGGEVA